MNWASGYVTEIDYTYDYFRELSTGLLRLACLSSGIALPSMHHIAYLELGYGQGLSINIHAAACAGEFWGTDFNPTHAAHARSLASASGSAAMLLDESFTELAARSDLPEFDIIALHGVWTWVSDENRRTIVDLIRRKLRVGGLVYLSYNCLPGRAPVMPLRHLMTLHADLAGSDAAGMVSKIDGALAFAQQVVDSDALYFKANPAVAERLKAMLGQNRNYLAHEYFNRYWAVMPFSDVARWLEDGKVTFATSAHLVDHIEDVHLTAEGYKLLTGIPHPVLRQSVRDYLTNQIFRRDIFIKGLRRLTPLEHLESLRTQQFVLTTLPSEIPMTVKGARGEVALPDAIYRPIIEAMAEDNFKPKALGQVAANAKLASLQFNQIVRAAILLTGVGYMHPAQVSSKETHAHCVALNQYICQRARSSSDISFLASPVTGCGFPVSRSQQLFLLAAANNRKAPEEHAKFAWEILAAQGHCLIKEGKALTTPEENLSELTKQAAEFAEKRLPVLKALEVSI
jgi:hypothetical protein